MRVCTPGLPSFRLPLRTILVPLISRLGETIGVLSLLQRLVIDQSPREGAGVQEQQEQRERPRGRAAVTRVPVLHGRRMLP